MKNESCGTCMFYLATKPHQGLCRRNPPQIAVVGASKSLAEQRPQFIAQGFFPPVVPHGWCGEYRPEEASNVQ